MKKVLLFLSLLVVTFFAFGCTIVQPNNVDGITITSEGSVRTVKVGETLQLTAKVFPDTADQTVLWTSSDANIATVNEAGLVTAVSEGKVDVIATSNVDTTVSQSYSLIIEKAEPKEIEAENIIIETNESLETIKVGDTVTLTATVSPSEANQAVTWTSSDPEIATVNRGEVTALKEGTVTITAAAKGNEKIKDSIVLTIEKNDAPEYTKDWKNMSYTTHTQYVECENDSPIKVKGVVTHVSPEKDKAVSYFIQNGNEGFYVYSQDSSVYPVELGKVYEVGGFKKNYRGLMEIVNVEYFVEVNETITANKIDVNSKDVTNLNDMNAIQCSLVTGTAVLEEASVNDSKAYSFYAVVNGKLGTFRVDPSYMTSEEYASINTVLKGAVKGMEFEFVGFITAFGYGTPEPQIQITKAADLTFKVLSDKDLLTAAASSLTISNSIALGVDKIELPTTMEGFEGLTISWASNKTEINVETGAVTHTSENVTVTLTATLVKGEEKLEKTYDVLIFAEDNKTYEVVASFDSEDAEAPNSWGNSASKSSYAAATVTLGTPKAPWLLQNALIAAATNDIYDGTLGIRAQAGKTAAETARIEIKQDGEYNVVEFAAAVYGNDASGIQIRIEYSTDQGSSWIVADGIITIDSKTLQTYRVTLPTGAKRVAIVVVENTGRRVNIDNIKLMK